MLVVRLESLAEATLGTANFKKLFQKIQLSTKEYDGYLSNLDPITYAYLLTIKGETLSSKEAIKLLNLCGKDERVGLLLWCFGQMRLWDVLIKFIKQEKLTIQK